MRDRILLGASVLAFLSLCWVCLARNGGLQAAEASVPSGPLSTITLTWHGTDHTITGVVPDAAVKAQVQARVESLSTDAAIQNRLDTGERAAPAPWLASVLDAISAVRPALETGELRIDGTRVTIAGDVATEAERVETQAALSKAVGSGFTVASTIEVSPRAAARRVEGDLAERLSSQPIEFRPGSAIVADGSRALVSEVGAMLARVPEAQVEVRAHVAGLRDERRNQTLSDNRARAVRTLLIGQGLEASRISTVGLGASQWTSPASGLAVAGEQGRIEFALVVPSGEPR